MSGLILPDAVRESMEREQLVDDHLARGKWLGRELRALDPALSCVWVKENVPEHVAERHGMVPGRWHVRRENQPPAEPSYKPIVGPLNEYREPDSGVLEELRRQDMWNPEVAARYFGETKRKEAERERDAARVREARREDIALNVKAKLNPGVSFGDGRWSYRAGAKRAA